VGDGLTKRRGHGAGGMPSMGEVEIRLSGGRRIVFKPYKASWVARVTGGDVSVFEFGIAKRTMMAGLKGEVCAFGGKDVAGQRKK